MYLFMFVIKSILTRCCACCFFEIRKPDEFGVESEQLPHNETY